jgi:uncharacterized protein YbjT (DUF2867 family)
MGGPMQSVLIFGATGMVGQGVLRECLKDSHVKKVLSIGRTTTGLTNPKFREIIDDKFGDFGSIEKELTGLDACFFCLGTPSAGKPEAEYRRITYDLTLGAATLLSRLNPTMTFIYVSGEGADSSEKGRVMWARVRGQKENALFRLPFKAVYVFRPAVIQPLNHIKSKTPAYRLFYSLAKPVLPILRLAFPNHVSSTEQLGRAMLLVTRNGASKKILKTRDFNEIARQ